MSRSSRRGAALFAVTLAVVLTACHTAIPPEPALRVSADRFRSELRVLCADSIRSDLGFVADDDRLVGVERTLVSELQKRGFQVHLREAWSEVFAEGFAQAEPSFDPHTGRRDDVRYERAQRAARRLVHERVGCGAFLQPSIVLVTAPWRRREVEWDGQTHWFYEAGSRNAYGYVSALSLHLRIRDVAGALVYFGTGGIEVTSELRASLFREEFEDVGTSELLTRPSRVRSAVQAALAGLPGRPAP